MSKQPIPNTKPAKSKNLIYKNHHHNINASIRNLFKCNPQKKKKKKELITPLLLSRYNY